jgi:hypothetical protein
MFSGGADSTTVLKSFTDNGIYPDEIYIQHWMEGQGGSKDGFMTGEVFHSAIPLAEKIVKQNPSIKLNIFDVSSIVSSLLCDRHEVERCFREVNNIHNLGQSFVHHNLPYRFDHWKNIYKKGGKIAFVWGETKPCINYDTKTKKHFFYFQDHYPHCPQPRDQENYDPLVHHEQFFDDPGFPEIKVKQCHLIKKILDQIRHRSDIFYSFDDIENFEKKNIKGNHGFEIKFPRIGSAYTVWQDKKYGLDRNAVNCTIYPGWDFLTYHQDKQIGRVWHPAWTWLDQKFPTQSRQWYTGFIKAYGNLPDYWTKYYGNLSKGIRRLDNIYYIE